MPCSSVVLVEDHVDTRLIWSSVLRHHGFIVAEGKNGEEGLQIARTLRPDAVITDLHLPKVDGCAVIQALKQEAHTAEIATLVLTVDGRPEARQQAQAAGCDEFIVKPTPPDHLVETVRRVIDASTRKAAATRLHRERSEAVQEARRSAEANRRQWATARRRQEADRKWMRSEVLGMLRSGWSWTELAEVGFTEAMLEQIGFDVEAPVAEWFKAEGKGRLG